VPNGGHGGTAWNASWVNQAVWDFFTATLKTSSAQALAPERKTELLTSSLPSISVQATDAKATEAGSTGGQFQISVSAPQASDLVVTYHTAGTTTSGADYIPLSGTAVIPAGQTSVNVDLQVIDDSDLETGEYVILALDPTPSYQVASPSEASVAIADDDYDGTSPILSAIATDFRASEPGTGTDTGEFTITRTGSTTAPLTVSLTRSGTAVSGTDYTGVAATVTFDAGVSRLAVVLTPKDDLANEGTETATLSVGPGTGMYLGRFDGNTVSIADDEPILGALALSALTVSPAALTGGGKATGTVTLNGPAPVAVNVSLSSSNAAATVPASLTIPAGASSATFSISTQVVSTDHPLTISATFRTVTKTAPLTVQAPVLSSLSLTPATFIGGCQTSTGKVTLTGKAPTGGLVISLTNGNPVASMPSSVTVAAGATSASFSITAPAVTSNQGGTVTATQGSLTKSATLTVRPVGLASLNLSPNPVTGPSPVTGTVTLECPATPGPITVTLSTTSTVAQPDVPSLTIPQGQTTGTFNITTATVATQSKATIKAAANGGSKSVTLVVNP
jgi:hypothetical protein